MISMTMMGLDPGPLVRAIFHFALEIPLVVSVALALEFFLTGTESIGDVVLLVVVVLRGVDSKVGQLIGSF